MYNIPTTILSFFFTTSLCPCHQEKGPHRKFSTPPEDPKTSNSKSMPQLRKGEKNPTFLLVIDRWTERNRLASLPRRTSSPNNVPRPCKQNHQHCIRKGIGVLKLTIIVLQNKIEKFYLCPIYNRRATYSKKAKIRGTFICVYWCTCSLSLHC